MKKITLFVAFLLIFMSSNCYAIEQSHMYTEFGFYTASVYLARGDENTIILQNVRPCIEKTDGLRNARDIEYQEVWLNMDAVYDSDGTKINADQINTFLLGGKVKFVLARNFYKYRILYLKFNKE